MSTDELDGDGNMRTIKERMMRNFDYLHDLELNDLHRFCASAEEFQVTQPDISAISARKALEYMVRALYMMKNVQ